MLRTFKPVDSFRGLADEPFPSDQSDVCLGRLTVIYGRNGSGKSTFSEYLRGFPGELPRTEFRGTYFNESDGRVLSGAIPEDVIHDVHVYNRFYVDDNLHAFLSGDGPSDPIVVLGKANVDAQMAVEAAQAATAVQHERLRRAKEKVAKSSTRKDAAIQKVKSDVIQQLESVDAVNFNTTRFTITKAEALLLGPSGTGLDGQQLAERRKIAGEADKDEVELGRLPSQDLESIRSVLLTLIGRDIKNVSIDALQGDTSLSEWVEQGMGLHAPGEECKFCGEGKVTGETLQRYADHFNESFKELVTEIDQLRTRVGRLSAALEDVSWLPEVSDLLAAFQPDFGDALRSWADQAVAARKWLRDVDRLLDDLRRDPLGSHEPPPGLDTIPPLDMLAEIETQVEKNNLACEEQSTAKADALQEIQSHCASTHRAAYARAKITHKNAQLLVSRIEAQIRLLGDEENRHRARMSDTNSMASAIDADLKQVFGHDHLNVIVSEDSKGYKVIRQDGIAENLSEGERHAIALLYFIRSLERDGVTSEDDLVVIDDPVTSLDKEALFSAFSLLTSRLENFGQLVLLTHDYEFFRLFLVSKKTAHDASLKRIAENRSNEREFPAVRFLEMVSQRTLKGLDRRSFLRSLPNSLLAHPSEYHYLFWRVALALVEEDEASLPLLGNAARRLLEGFISFRAPHVAGFQEKINATADLALPPGEHPSAALIEIKERVTRFAHGTSHRAEPVPTTALDFPSVREELRQVLEFIQLCDPQHFERLVRSVGIPAMDLQLRLSNRLHGEESMTSYAYGRLEVSAPLIYAEVLRPNFVVYAMESPTDLPSLIAEIPGASRNGFWIVVSQCARGKAVSIDRCEYRATSPHALPELPKESYHAFFVTSAGEERWMKNDLHYFECILRSKYEQYGFDHVCEGARSANLPEGSEVCDPVLGQLPVVLGTLGIMLDQSREA